jgi:hypothetical protein
LGCTAWQHSLVSREDHCRAACSQVF